MAYVSIPEALRTAGKAVKEDLITNIHENLEDLNSRVDGLSISAGTIILRNDMIKKPSDGLPVGALIWGALSEAQYQGAADEGTWVLCDGDSCAGTDYATLRSVSVVPDVKGRFLRMKDHGVGRNPDGDVALDTAQASSYLNHSHAITGVTVGNDSHTHAWDSFSGLGRHHHLDFTIDSSGSSHTHTLDIISAGSENGGGEESGFVWNDDGVSIGTQTTNSSGAHSHTGQDTDQDDINSNQLEIVADTHNHTLSGSVANSTTGNATETRPINVTENLFIKTEKAYIKTNTQLFVIRVPQDCTVNQVQVTPVIPGTSGNLEIDIKKGTTVAGASTSIFTALPSLAWDDTDPVTGTINPAAAEVDSGHFLVVSISSTQTKLQAFHLFIGADV